MNLAQLLRTFSPPADPALLTYGIYDPWLVALSVVTAIFSSWMGLQLAGQATGAGTRSLRMVALLTGSLALGSGVWAMHFIGMLAFNLCTEVTYDPTITIWSMLPSIAASYVALSLLGRSRIGIWQLLSGGLLVGAGIGAMHYAGMAALHSTLELRYDPFMFGLSIVVAVVLATLALWVRFGLRSLGSRLTPGRLLLMSAVVMGCAIAGMHYTGMAAARFVGQAAVTQAGGATNVTFIALAVALITVAFTILVVAANGLLRYRQVFNQLRESESGMRAMMTDLRDAKERAEQGAAARTAFLANMSHEIRTPMNSIIGFTDVLLHGELAIEQRRHLNTVRSAARSLLRLLNEILDTAKLDKGAMELELANFNLLGLIDELSSTLGISARARGLSLKIRYDSRLPLLYHGDELRVRQVLTNLLGNAIKFTNAGSVTLEVEAQDEQLHFIVRDTGIGIAADRLGSIFDPFMQADASMSRRFGGTGLGTTISKQLTELMGGRIWAESVAGQGSAFHVLLPLAAASPVPARAANARAVMVLPPLRILVTDDVPQNIELLRLLLGRLGHTVLTASDGHIAVSLAASEAIDVILMDVQMPAMNGLEATRCIRQDEAASGRRRTPVIAMTASVLHADRIAAREAGMDGFASKPVDLTVLTFEIARVLGIDSGVMSESDRACTAQTLNSAAALQRWAGERLTYCRALRRFDGDLATLAESLAALLEADELAEAGAQAHKFKGVAGNLGLELLAATLDRLERALATADRKKVADELRELNLQARAAREAIRAEVGALAATAGAPAPSEPLEASRILALGATLSESFQRGAHDDVSIGELTAALRGHVEPERLSRLQEALDDFDFAAAHARLAALLAELQSQFDRELQ